MREKTHGGMSMFFMPGNLVNRFRGYEIGVARVGHAIDARPRRCITVEECMLENGRYCR